MKTKSASYSPGLVNRNLANACQSPLCRSSLLLFRQQTDVLDATIRVFLVLCLVAALGLFGAEVTAGDRPALPAMVAATPSARHLSLLAIPAKASRVVSSIASPAL